MLQCSSLKSSRSRSMSVPLRRIHILIIIIYYKFKCTCIMYYNSNFSGARDRSFALHIIPWLCVVWVSAKWTISLEIQQMSVSGSPVYIYISQWNPASVDPYSAMADPWWIHAGSTVPNCSKSIGFIERGSTMDASWINALRAWETMINPRCSPRWIHGGYSIDPRTSKWLPCL